VAYVNGLWEPDRAAGEAPRFSVVWRGYDRHQVDECVRAMLNSPGKSLTEVFPEGNGPLFDVVLRGYARHEVDGYFGQFPR
jgi:hypothetical protein